MNSDFLPRRPQQRRTNFARPHQPSFRPQRSVAAFRSPEEVAAEEEKLQPTSTTEPEAPIKQTVPAKTKKPKFNVKAWFQKLTKKQKIILAVAVVVVLAVAGAAVYFLWPSPKPVVKNTVTIQKAQPKPTPQPTTVASTLTGLQVDPSINQRPVTAIMMENSDFARPQSGLIDAGVIFEAVAEGGITRFLTLFQDTSPEYVGPVRSVRPYYVQWLNGFDAAVAHVGGSADGLAMLRANGDKDLDQFYNPGPYWRISSRVAPHNMYTSVTKLRALQISKGWGTSNYKGFTRKASEAPSATPTARTIDFSISGPDFDSHYDYDTASNTYKRSEGGAPHVDAATGTQLAPKVVIALIMNEGRNDIYTTYDTIGSGPMYVFQDGTVTQGTWTKTSNSSQFVFKDSSDKEIKLNPGQTWLTVLGSTSDVSYKP